MKQNSLQSVSLIMHMLLYALIIDKNSEVANWLRIKRLHFPPFEGHTMLIIGATKNLHTYPQKSDVIGLLNLIYIISSDGSLAFGLL